MSPSFMQTLMSRTTLLFTLALFALGSVILLYVNNTPTPKNTASLNTNVVTDWTSYTSAELGISFHYPSGWTVDETQKSNFALTVRETPSTTNASQLSGYLGIDTSRTNTELLSPEVWFTKVMVPNIDPPISASVTTVNSMPAYTVLTNEQSQLRHTFIFFGTKVIEIYFPTDQPALQNTYTSILDSLQVK